MDIYSEIMLFKHTWAITLKEAILNAGGIALVQGKLSPLAFVETVAEIAAKVETAERIEPS
jgi:hypothetical protein